MSATLDTSVRLTTYLSRQLACSKCDGPVAESGDGVGFKVYEDGVLIGHLCVDCGTEDWLAQGSDWF